MPFSSQKRKSCRQVVPVANLLVSAVRTAISLGATADECAPAVPFYAKPPDCLVRFWCHHIWREFLVASGMPLGAQGAVSEGEVVINRRPLSRTVWAVAAALFPGSDANRCAPDMAISASPPCAVR